MIKVLHIIDTRGPGGAETVFTTLIKGLDPRSFSSVAIIPDVGWVNDSLKSAGFVPYVIPSKGKFNLRYLYCIIRVVKENNIDLIQSHLLGASLYACLAGIICRIPVVTTFHGFVDVTGNDLLFFLKRLIINYKSSKIVYVSNRLKEYFITHHKFSSERAEIIYNGIEFSNFDNKTKNELRKELNLSSDNIIIGAIGNIRPAKGYEYFLKAAEMIVREYPQCRFIVVGHGDGQLFDSLIALRHSLGLKNFFYFLGFRPDVISILNSIDIFVLPSVSEGFSISTIEAMACGRPVVVTRSGGPEEFIIQRKNGIIVDACSPLDLADGIRLLLKSQNLKDTLSANAQNSVKGLFSLKNMIADYRNLYRKVLRTDV